MIDRFIQQAIAQVVTTLFEPTFSSHSYGFRPKRSAHDAVRAAQAYIREGYDWVVDVDLEKYFGNTAKVAMSCQSMGALPTAAPGVSVASEIVSRSACGA